MNFPQKVAKNTIIILGGQIVSIILNLLVLVQLARYFGEEKYGMFSFAIVFINFFAIIPNFGMKPIIIREISGARDKASQILGTSIMIKFFFSIIGIGLAIITAILLDYSTDLTVLIAIVAFTIILSHKLTTFRFIFEAIFEAELRMEYPVIIRVLDAVLMLGSVLLLTHYNYSIETIMVFYVISSIPGFFLTMLLSLKYIKPSFSLNLQMIQWLFVESWPLAIYVALNTLYTNSDVFILKTLKSDADVGYYSAAYRLVYPLSFISSAVVMSLFPLMSQYFRDNKERLIRLFYFGMKIFLLIGLALAIGITFFHAQIIMLLYSNKYISSSISLMFLTWAESLFFLNFFLVDFNTSVHQQKRNMTATLFMVLANISLNLLVIPRWGINGASFIKIITNLFGFSILYFYISKELNINIFPIVKKIIPISFCFLIWLALVRNFNLFLVIGISPIIFIGLVFIFQFFTESEIRFFRGLFDTIVFRT